MAEGAEKSNDFYAVLGLKKDCTTVELRNAYKKLALKWHPDRCSASGSTAKHLEDAKKKFQAIQQAYSVLSNGDKRYLYDVGVYDCEDEDDENGMGDFLNEMVSMMSQSNEGNESLEQLQELFYHMFDSDINSFGSSSLSSSSCSAASPTYFSSPNPYSETHCKRTFSMISGNSKAKAAKFEGFSERVESGERVAGRAGDNRRNGRKQKIEPGQDVSSTISA